MICWLFFRWEKMNMKEIIWSEQHCGVHQASFDQLCELMPDLESMIILTFPEKTCDFTWDVKVHMLMPGQYPCIPNWHFDNVPRVNNQQDFSNHFSLFSHSVFTS